MKARKSHIFQQSSGRSAPKLRRLLFALASLGFIGATAFFFRAEEQPIPERLSKADLRSLIEALSAEYKGLQPPLKTDEWSQFGKLLFFDPDLSRNGSISCASCHQPELSFTDGKPLSFGIGLGHFNTPTLINMKDSHWFMWDGRAASLEAQAALPLFHRDEHGLAATTLAAIVTEKYSEHLTQLGIKPKPIPTVQATPPRSLDTNPAIEVAAYTLSTLAPLRRLEEILQEAERRDLAPVEVLKARYFKPEPDEEELTSNWQVLSEAEKRTTNAVNQAVRTALAAFQRTIGTRPSPFDRFLAKVTPETRLDSSLVEGFGASEWRGLKLFFGRGQCHICHQGPHLTDQQFHNIGLPADPKSTAPLGRARGILQALSDPKNCSDGAATESCRELEFVRLDNLELVGAFKTPTLRNLKDTAPYGHDGRFTTIEDILDHYNRAEGIPSAGHREEMLVPLGLNDRELTDLKNFLLSHSSEVTF